MRITGDGFDPSFYRQIEQVFQLVNVTGSQMAYVTNRSASIIYPPPGAVIVGQFVAGFSSAIVGNGLTGSFTDTSSDTLGTVITWQWDFGDGGSSSVQNPVHSYPSGTATYLVRLTASDNGALARNTASLFVLTNITPVAMFTSSFSAVVSGSFTDQSFDVGGTVVGWQWDFGDGTTSTTQNPTKVFASGSIYRVALTASDNQGATNITSSLFTVDFPPAARFTASLGLALSVSFTDQSSDVDGTVTSWSWNFGDGTTSTQQSPTKVYTDGGLYTVALTSSDNLGRSAITSSLIAAIFRDGPFAVMVPTNSASWNALQVWGINVPAPSIGWGCQEPTGTVLFPMSGPIIENVLLTQFGIGHLYNQSITGWNRKFLGFSAAASTRGWSVLTSSLTLVLSQSHAMMVLGSPSASVGSFASVGAGTGNGTALGANLFSTVHGGTTTSVTTSSFSSSLNPHPFVWHRDISLQRVGLTTDIFHITGSNNFSAQAAGAANIGASAGNTVVFNVGAIYVWKSGSAQRDWKQVLKWLHWPVTY